MDISTTFDQNLFFKACKLVIQYDKCSSSLIQRRLSVGYARAARIMDQLEQAGVVSPAEGSKPREVLIKSLDELKLLDLPKEPEPFSPPSHLNYKKVTAKFIPKEYLDFNVNEILLGKDTKQNVFKIDLDEVANLVIEGNAISTKFEFINNYLSSLVSNFDQEKVRLILQDSTNQIEKMTKFPHLLTPLITDKEKLIPALRWVWAEADRRFKMDSINDLPKIMVIINLNYFNFEEIDILKIISSSAYKVGIHIILLTTYIKDIPITLRKNSPALLEFDKYGDHKAIYKFKEKIKLDTLKVPKSEVKDYLS